MVLRTQPLHSFAHFLSSRLKQFTRSTAPLVGSIALLTACSSSSSSTETPEEPPTLELLGAQSADGTTYELSDDVIQVSCDPRVTLLLGPASGTSGVLDNWRLRPTQACDGQSQCGYLRIEILDDNRASLLTIHRASISPVVSLGEVDVSSIRAVTATLMDANTDEVFLLDEGGSVGTTWDVKFNLNDCEMGAGGAENLSGDGGAPSMGGAAGGASP